MSIVSVPTGNDYSRMTAEILNASWDQANMKYAALDQKLGLLTGATGWLSTTAAPHITAGMTVAPTVEEPNVSIPTTIDTSTILATFKAEYEELVALLVDKFTAFQGQFFPHDQINYDAAEAWLSDGLANNSGLPSYVRDQIESDDHSRIIAEANRADDAMVAKFAGMRFPMPPGALASARLQIAQKKQDAMAESSRKITIASVEQLKWTVDKMLSLRQMAMSSALDYIKSLVSAPQIASQVTGIGYDAQTKLISSASQFYGVRADVAKITAQSDQYNVSTALEASAKNQAADLTVLEDRVKALLTEISALAQMTTSLFNNLHASAGVSASDSNSHSY